MKKERFIEKIRISQFYLILFTGIIINRHEIYIRVPFIILFFLIAIVQNKNFKRLNTAIDDKASFGQTPIAETIVEICTIIAVVSLFIFVFILK